MDALRRMSGINVVLVAVGLVALSLVRAKPLLEGLEDLEIDVPVAGCFSRENNRTYAVGEKWATGPPFMCARMQCTGPNAFLAVPCAAYIAPEWCNEEPGDQTAVYPACCPYARCSEESLDTNTPKPTDATWDLVEQASNAIP